MLFAIPDCGRIAIGCWPIWSGPPSHGGGWWLVVPMISLVLLFSSPCAFLYLYVEPIAIISRAWPRCCNHHHRHCIVNQQVFHLGPGLCDVDPNHSQPTLCSGRLDVRKLNFVPSKLPVGLLIISLISHGYAFSISKSDE